jgi:hypothetical protein
MASFEPVMSQCQEPSPGKLFLSVLFRGTEAPQDTAEVADVMARLRKAYGPTDVESPVLAFPFTQYYAREMGAPLWRRFFTFGGLVKRDALVDAKRHCLELEQRHADPAGNRRVNLDPGILSVENLVLATGKNFAHRIYLGRGVFADLTLLYRNHRFKAMPWTYPDYASDEVGRLLIVMRQRLLEQLKS